MAASVTDKRKCNYWDKCYRKNKQHRDQFLHPGDGEEEEKEEEEEEELQPKPRLVHDISQNDDDPIPAKKTAAKRKSSDDNDVSTHRNAAAAAGPSTSTDDSHQPSPTKKAKYDGKDEIKIAPDYSKPKKTGGAGGGGGGASTSATVSSSNSDEDGGKEDEEKTADVEQASQERKRGKCKYWEKCYQTGAAHKKDFYHPGENVPKEGPRTQKNAKPKKAALSSHIKVSLLLAHKYDEQSNNPLGWWISEKLDGVRAFWNGRCFYSRLGNAFYAPHWFTKDLPTDMTLDGELFGGRGQFQSTVSIVKTAESPKWKDIKYYVFDSPNMGKETFENRMEKIKDYFEETRPQYAVFVEQVKCTSQAQLDARLDYVLNIGGEGLMIRQPRSVYERTRSKTLLKIKKFYDAEAIVIGHERGKGVNQHRCGALRCRMACGVEFSVGSGLTDKDRNKPPKVGTIITYKFQELSKSGTPRFPTYVGIRIDMTEPKDAEIREVLDADDA